jgi:hypothetical protein
MADALRGPFLSSPWRFLADQPIAVKRAPVRMTSPPGQQAEARQQAKTVEYPCQGG